MESRVNILLINDTTDWCHWGCTGTSSVLKERIKKLNFQLDTFPARETYKFGWEGRPSIADHFNDHEMYKNFYQKNPILLAKMNAADAIVINGEGTIHGVKHAPLNLLYLAYISKIFLNKHVEIINHSVFPEDGLTVDDSNTKLLYQMVYKELDYIAVREPLSLDILKKLCIDANHSFDCLPLYIKEHYQRINKKSSKQVVVSGSADWQNSNLSALADYFDWLARQGFKIHLLIGAKGYHASDSRLVNFLDDDKIINFFKSRLSHIDWQLKEAKSMDEWLNTIAGAQLLVSGRFHHSIAAACLGTRFIAMNSNTPKIDGLMQILGLPASLQASDTDLFNKLVLKTKAVLNSSIDDRENDVMEALCKLAENNFNGLKLLA